MRNTEEKVRVNSLVTFSCEPLNMDQQVLDNQQELIDNSSV